MLLLLRSRYKASRLTQLKWLVWRAFLASYRNPTETKVHLIQSLLIGFLLGVIFIRLQLNQEGVQDIDGVLFLLITESSFANLYGVLDTFPSRVTIFLREHQNRMYSVSNFFFAQTICELPRFVVFPLIFTTIVYWLSNLNNDPARYVLCCCTIILIANAAVSFGRIFCFATFSFPN